MRFIGRREGIGPELIERMDWAEEDDRRQRADHPLRRLQLRRPGGDPRRGARASRASRGGVPRPPLRARDARPRPADPHQRRAADLQLPALAVRLLGARLPRRAVARLHARGVRGVAGRVRGAPAALRGARRWRHEGDGGVAARERGDSRPFDAELDLDAGTPPTSARRQPPLPASSREPRRAPSPRRRAGARPLARRSPGSSWAIPWIVSRDRDRRRRRAALRRSRWSASPCIGLCASSSAMTRATRPLVAGRLRRRRRRWSSPPTSATSSRSCCVARGGVPGHVLRRRPARPTARASRVSIAVTLLGVVWIGLPFAHAVLLRELPVHGGGAADRRPRRHLRRRHRRLRRRPPVRPPPARAGPLAEQDARGPVGGFVGGTMGFWFAGLYQDWLSGLDALLMGMCGRRPRAGRRPLRVDDQARPRHQGHGQRLRPPRRPPRPPRRGPVHDRRRLLPRGGARLLSRAWPAWGRARRARALAAQRARWTTRPLEQVSRPRPARRGSDSAHRPARRRTNSRSARMSAARLPRRLADRPGVGGADHARRASGSISPSPRFAWRSAPVPGGSRESFACRRSIRPMIARTRSTASESSSPAAWAWQVSKQKPSSTPVSARRPRPRARRGRRSAGRPRCRRRRCSRGGAAPRSRASRACAASGRSRRRCRPRRGRGGRSPPRRRSRRRRRRSAGGSCATRSGRSASASRR